MKHVSEEQIVLHYYGDAEAEEAVCRHLGDCRECQTEFERVKAFLERIEPTEVPEPPQFFEEKTWLKLRDRLAHKPGSLRGWLAALPQSEVPSAPRSRAWWGGKWAVAGIVAVLVLAAFLIGRFGPSGKVVSPSNAIKPNSERVVLVAVGDHLHRSQILLVEIMNSDVTDGAGLSNEQRHARDLLDANHLYRVSVQQSGDTAVASLLDDLGRVLTEIANAPSTLTPADLQAIRGRIQSQGLLFKIRVVGSEVDSNVRSRQEAQAGRDSTI